MAYAAHLADRVARVLAERHSSFEEKKMMGGLAFMVNGKMCVGVMKETLMVRLAPEKYESALARPGARPMDFTGRSMKGFVFVEAEGTDSDSSLEFWVDLALEFNPRAKAAGKRRE